MQKIILSAKASNPYNFNVVGERWGSFKVACICLKCILLTERLNTLVKPDFFPLSPPLSLILHLLYQIPHGFCPFHFAKCVPEHEISRSFSAFLFWSGLCAVFPTTCHWFVTLQQVSSGQTSRGEFCVSTQLHKPATFLHADEGFPHANRGAGSYLISCKGLVFRLNTGSAACSAHKILAICSEQVPLCAWGETRECSTSAPPCSRVLSHHPNRNPGEMQRSPHSCNHRCDMCCGHFHISKCTFWFNWGIPPTPHPSRKYLLGVCLSMCTNEYLEWVFLLQKRSAAGDCARSVML